MGAYSAAEMNSQLFAAAVTMPVLMFQVLEDAWNRIRKTPRRLSI